MKKSETIIKKVATEVKAEMMDSILQGCDWMVFEQEINGVPVKVEIREVRLKNGYYIDDVDVFIEHDDTSHQSPLLEKAIREALPNWFNVKAEVNRQIA